MTPAQDLLAVGLQDSASAALQKMAEANVDVTATALPAQRRWLGPPVHDRIAGPHCPCYVGEQRPKDHDKDGVMSQQSGTEMRSSGVTENGRRMRTHDGGQTGAGPDRAVQRTQRRLGGLTSSSEHTPPLLGLNPLALFLSMNPLLNPFALMRQITEYVDLIVYGPARGGGRPAPQARPFVPQIETFQRDGEMVVRADLPGLTADQVTVRVDEDTLVIEGERRFENEERRGGAYIAERGYGMFRREVPLPPARQEEIRAQFDNGVLEVAVPLDEDRGRGRRIEIPGPTRGPGTGTGTSTRTSAVSARRTTGTHKRHK